MEVGGRVFLDRLPGWLSGIGVEANYTYLDSKIPGDLYYDINGVAHNDVPLQGLSKHNANVAFLYEHNPFSLRIAYSWRSKYLQSTNANGTNQSYTFYTAPGVGSTVVTDLPIYGADYGTLDGGVTVKVNDRLSFQIQATNITNATQRTLMGGYPERCALWPQLVPERPPLPNGPQRQLLIPLPPGRGGADRHRSAGPSKPAVASLRRRVFLIRFQAR
jgi:outer membrane receptor protein involved in Fe transport